METVIVYLLEMKHSMDCGINGIVGVFSNREKALEAAQRSAFDYILWSDNPDAQPVLETYPDNEFSIHVGERDNEGYYEYEAEYRLHPMRLDREEIF